MGVIHLLFVTRDKDLHKEIDFRKGGLLPVTRRKSGHHVVEVSAFLLRTSDAAALAEEHVVTLGQTAVGLIVICDVDLRASLAPIEDTCLLNSLPVRKPSMSLFNHIARTASLVLTDYDALRLRAAQAKNLKILLLPLRNFVAPELKAIEAACIKSLETRSFAAVLDQNLEKMRQLRQNPKRKSSYKDVYLVDDLSRHYAYGHEDHSQCETGPPHNKCCVLRRDFRFGVRIEHPQRHFNVSYDGKSIKGETFTNCHLADQKAPRDKHFNVFPGGFAT